MAHVIFLATTIIRLSEQSFDRNIRDRYVLNTRLTVHRFAHYKSPYSNHKFLQVLTKVSNQHTHIHMFFFTGSMRHKHPKLLTTWSWLAGALCCCHLCCLVNSFNRTPSPGYWLQIQSIQRATMTPIWQFTFMNWLCIQYRTSDHIKFDTSGFLCTSLLVQY